MTKRRNEKNKKKRNQNQNWGGKKTLTSWVNVVQDQRFEVNVHSMSNVPHTKHERREIPCHSLNKQQQQAWHKANMTTKETSTIGWKHEIRSHKVCG